MFEWLLGRKKINIEPAVVYFSKLDVGQKFRKIGWDEDGKLYKKTAGSTFETIETGWHPIKWYLVSEDFLVKKVQDLL